MKTVKSILVLGLLVSSAYAELEDLRFIDASLKDSDLYAELPDEPKHRLAEIGFGTGSNLETLGADSSLIDTGDNLVTLGLDPYAIRTGDNLVTLGLDGSQNGLDSGKIGTGSYLSKLIYADDIGGTLGLDSGKIGTGSNHEALNKVLDEREKRVVGRIGVLGRIANR